jgi:hypothetical protein
VIAGASKRLDVEIGLLGTAPGQAVLEWGIQPVFGPRDDASEALSLGGLPPGTPIYGSTALEPGQSTRVSLDLAYQDAYPIGYDRLVLFGDEDGDGVTEDLGEIALRSIPGTPLDVPDAIGDDRGGPDERLLLQLPNPFAPSDRITFRVEGEGPETVNLRLFDLSGRLVKTLQRGAPLAPGEYTVAWDTHDDRGQPLPSGVYFLRLEIGRDKRVETAKVLVRR